MRCVAGHQANLYPYGGFFAKAASVETFVIVDTTQYVKKEYHNRNRIKLSNGTAHWLRIPVKTAGRFTQCLKDVEIKEDTGWQRVHRRCLEVNYAKSPHFDRYYPPLRELLSRRWRRLSAYAIAVIRVCFELLGVTPEVRLASELGIEGKKAELILHLCRATGGDAYLHGKHGRDYVDFGFLKAAGIHNLIQEYRPAPYPQPWGPFLGNLSVLDILFNCGPDSLDVIMAGNAVRDAETNRPVDDRARIRNN
jgi:hypothetical protein